LDVGSEIITVGNELISGIQVDTNGAYLAEQLWGCGIPVRRIVSVGDDAPALAAALIESLARAPIVLVTGGLGPTDDDLTTEVVAQVIKPDTARKMRAALQKVTETGGTATLAAVPGYKVAGKTGTAKRHNPNGRGYLANSYTVSFVGMLPAQNPAFVCVVVIDDPRTDKVPRYGGTIAAPAFGHIAARAAAYMNLQPTVPVTPPLATAAVR
jgi:molybdenum cofactor synthesis domain-containing protein